MTFPPIGVTAIIAGMSVFNRDAAIVESRLLRINSVANQMQNESAAGAAGAAAAFGDMAATITTAATVIAGAAALAGAASIKFAADFQEQITLTQALTGATKPEIDSLTGTIVNLSRTGTLGMNDLNKAALELARAGVPIEDVMNGALKAVQNLTIASGGEIGLEKAAKLTATAMNAFGLSVDEVDRVTTAAAVVAQNSALTFTDFGTAVQYAAPTFKAAGFTIEDLAVAEALLGKNGITGSVAATSLRGVIQRLIRPSKDAQKVMDEYGISLFDSSGKAYGFDVVLKQLNNAFSDQAVASGKLTEEQRLQAISTLGLQRTGAAFLILANATTQTLDDLRASFDKLKASDLVEIMLQTFNAQLKIAQNNVTALAFAFGNVFLPILTDVVKSTNTWLKSISTNVTADWGMQVITAMTGFVTAVKGAVGATRDFIDGLGLTDATLQFLKTTLATLATIIAVNVTTAILGAVGAWGLFFIAVGTIGTVISKVSSAIAGLLVQFAQWSAQFGPLGLAISHFASDIAMGFSALSDLLNGDVNSAVVKAGAAFDLLGQDIKTHLGEGLQAVATLLTDTGASLAPWAAQAGDAGTVVSNSLSGLSGIVESLQYLLQGNFPAAAAAAQGALANFQAAVQPIVDALQGALTAALDWLINVGWPLLQKTASDAATTFNTEVRPALEKIGAALHDAFDWAITTGIPTLDGLISGLTNTIKDHTDIVIGVAAAYVAWRTAVIAIAVIGAIVPVITTIVSIVVALSSAIGVTIAAVATAPTAFAALGVVLQTVGIIIGGIVAALGGPLTIAIIAIVAIVGVLTAAWVGNWGDIQGKTAAVVDFVGAAIGALSSEVGREVTVISDAITSAWNTILGVTQAVWGAIPDNIKDDVNAIIVDVGDILGLLPDIAQHQFEMFLDAAIQVLGPGVELVLSVINGLTAMIIDALTKLVGDAGPPVQDFVTQVGATISQFAQIAIAAASQLGGDLVAGMVSGIFSRVGEITSAARSMVESALAAAREAAGAHSPSREMEDLGEDYDAGLAIGIEGNADEVVTAGVNVIADLSDSMVSALEAAKRPIRGTAATLVDDLLKELSSIQGRINVLASDMESKMARIGEDVGRKVNEAIIDAAKQIEKTVSDANDRIQDLQNNLAQGRSDKGRRDTLSEQQNAARSARKNAQEDADAQSKHTRDLADAEFQHQQDLADATNQKQRTAADDKYNDKVADLNRSFKLDEAARAEARARQADDAAFEQTLAQQTFDLNEQLENESLARAVANAQADRDARITAINEALAEKETKIREQAQREIDNLRDNTAKKIDILEKEFAQKAADVLRKGGEQMRPLVDNIQSILSGNFEAMRTAADDFTTSVEDAIGALKRLEEQRRKAQFAAPSLPSPTNNLGTSAPEPKGPTHGLLEFGDGGMVPGPFGRPMTAIVHGGEFIAGLHSEASRMMRMMAGTQPTSSTTYEYNISPRYENYQSPASVEMDIRALVAMSKGG